MEMNQKWSLWWAIIGVLSGKLATPYCHFHLWPRGLLDTNVEGCYQKVSGM